MPRVSESFPSKTLSAADIEEEDVVITIADVYEKQYDDGTKYIIESREAKDFVCNKTNANTIARIYGDDTDDWIGKRITLFATEVQSQKGMVLAIRVRSRPPRPKAEPEGRPAGKPGRPVTQAEADMSDDEWQEGRE